VVPHDIQSRIEEPSEGIKWYDVLQRGTRQRLIDLLTPNRYARATRGSIRSAHRLPAACASYNISIPILAGAPITRPARRKTCQGLCHYTVQKLDAQKQLPSAELDGFLQLLPRPAQCSWPRASRQASGRPRVIFLQSSGEARVHLRGRCNGHPETCRHEARLSVGPITMVVRPGGGDGRDRRTWRAHAGTFGHPSSLRT